MERENLYKRRLKHYVAIAVVGDLYQATCNPFKCGWKGSVTDRPTAEFEREIHYIEILDLDTKPFPQ